MVGVEEFQHRGIDACDSRIVGSALEEVLDQEREVSHALPQRWKLDLNDREPVVQVLSEASGLHFFPKIPVGGPDHAHVHRPDAPRSDPADLTLLQHSKQLRLQIQWELSDLVEEDGAPVRLLKDAFS